MSTTDICFMTATELARRIRAKELSAREVMEAHLTQIERVNLTANAIVTLLPERAMAGARAADEALAHGAACGPLAWLAHRPQRSLLDQRHPYHLWLAYLRRFRA